MVCMGKREVGIAGESAAQLFLVKRGFKILETNYRKRWGEIDIIAEKDGEVRFVEVKAISREMGDGKVSREIDHQPEDMVNKEKLRKVARTASLYMESKRDKREYQIDVVGVFVDMKRRIARCRLIEQALEDNI